jgi:hypothetical protein
MGKRAKVPKKWQLEKGRNCESSANAIAPLIKTNSWMLSGTSRN